MCGWLAHGWWRSSPWAPGITGHQRVRLGSSSSLRRGLISVRIHKPHTSRSRWCTGVSACFLSSGAKRTHRDIKTARVRRRAAGAIAGAFPNHVLIGSTIMALHDLAISTSGVLTTPKSLACRKHALSFVFSASLSGSALEECGHIFMLGNECGGMSATLSPLTTDETADPPDRLLRMATPTFLGLCILPVDVLICLFRGHSRYVRVVDIYSSIIATRVRICATIEVYGWVCFY